MAEGKTVHYTTYEERKVPRWVRQYNSFMEQFAAEREQGERLQEMMNARAARQGGLCDKAALVFWADLYHRPYPQYRGHWDGPDWVVEIIERDVRTKMGLAFKAGDVALVKYERSRISGTTNIVAYSLRHNVDTSIGWY